jgi:hypothetical protein
MFSPKNIQEQELMEKYITGLNKEMPYYIMN